MLYSADIKKAACEVGFDLCGIARTRNFGAERQFFDAWLARGYDSGLGYLRRNVDKRFDAAQLVPGARSVIVCAVAYKNELSAGYADSAAPRISSYALSADYHDTIKGMLARMAEKLTSVCGDFAWRSFVDTAPMLEKRWAVEAGLGFIGRNSLLVNPRFGSFLFLGELVVDADADQYDQPYRSSPGGHPGIDNPNEHALDCSTDCKAADCSGELVADRPGEPIADCSSEFIADRPGKSITDCSGELIADRPGKPIADCSGEQIAAGFYSHSADRPGCGQCRRCVAACPNGAITPNGIDTRLCISRLTVEKLPAGTATEGVSSVPPQSGTTTEGVRPESHHPGAATEGVSSVLPQSGATAEGVSPAPHPAGTDVGSASSPDDDFRELLHGWIFGCDECQSVCPYNRPAPLYTNPSFRPRFDPCDITREEWLAMTDDEYARRFGQSPMSRTSLSRIKANIK